MTFDFENVKIDVDVDATKAFYEKTTTTTQKCDCIDCRNYEKYTEYLSPKVASFFDALGIRADKSAKMAATDTSNADVIVYDGSYHVLGKLLAGEGETVALTRNYSVTFSSAVHDAEPELPDGAVEICIHANVPWTLTVKNPY